MLFIFLVSPVGRLRLGLSQVLSTLSPGHVHDKGENHELRYDEHQQRKQPHAAEAEQCRARDRIRPAAEQDAPAERHVAVRHPRAPANLDKLDVVPPAGGSLREEQRADDQANLLVRRAEQVAAAHVDSQSGAERRAAHGAGLHGPVVLEGLVAAGADGDDAEREQHEEGDEHDEAVDVGGRARAQLLKERGLLDVDVRGRRVDAVEAAEDLGRPVGVVRLGGLQVGVKVAPAVDADVLAQRLVPSVRGHVLVLVVRPDHGLRGGVGVVGVALPLGAGVAHKLDRTDVHTVVADRPRAGAELPHQHAVVLAAGVVLREHVGLLVTLAELDAARAHKGALFGDGVAVDEEHERPGHDGAGADGEPAAGGQRLVGRAAHLDGDEHVVGRRRVVVVHVGGHAEARAVSVPAVDAELGDGGRIARLIVVLAAVR